MAYQPEMIVVDKQRKMVVVINVAIPNCGNIRRKEHEKLKKTQGLREELENMQRVKASVVWCPVCMPVGIIMMIWALGQADHCSLQVCV